MGEPKRNNVVEHFRIIEMIGEGSFSRVHKAYDEKLERMVALKILSKELLNDAEMLCRFRQESVIAAKIDNPNVVRVFDAGVSADECFIAFELVEGVTLREWIRFTDPDLPAICRILHQVFRGVAAAHDLGIVHRDLKPENVLLDLSGTPKVTDFGLASIPENKMTTDNVSLGTVAYMSPEQARGQSDRLTSRSDVFSLGVILFECITKQLPIHAATHAEYLASLASREILSVREFDRTVPVELGAIVDKCLSHEPRYRYKDSSVLADDIHRYMIGQPTMARPLSRTEKAIRYFRKHQLAVLATVAIALTLITSTFVSIGFMHSANESKALQEQTTNVALDTLVDGICSCRSEQLRSTVHNARPLASQIKERLNERSLLSLDCQRQFNARVAMILLYGDEKKFSEILADVNSLGTTEFVEFLKSASVFDRTQIELAVRAVTAETDSQYTGRHCAVSLLLGTGNKCYSVVSNDAEPSDRNILIDAIVDADGANNQAQIALDSECADALKACLITGIGEWQSELGRQFLDRLINYSTSENRFLRASACYALLRHREYESFHEISKTSEELRGIDLVPITKNRERPFSIMSTELKFGDLQLIASRAEIDRIFKRMNGKKIGRGGVAHDRPITGLTFEEIVSICNALNNELGLEPTYDESFHLVHGTNGFRLPTLEEWKFAAQVDANTKYFFGDDPSQLEKYGVVVSAFSGDAEVLPSASRRPNPHGMFDVYGNAAEVVHGTEDKLLVVGGSSWATPEQCVPSSPTRYIPSITVGIRLVRSTTKD